MLCNVWWCKYNGGSDEDYCCKYDNPVFGECCHCESFVKKEEEKDLKA